MVTILPYIVWKQIPNLNQCSQHCQNRPAKVQFRLSHDMQKQSDILFSS